MMMVGEIRDQETADIAIEASLTGHLVLSTIHTNSAAETLTRLINLGIKTFLLPATINAIIAQRLVRRINKDKAKRVSFSELDINLQQRVKNVIASTPQAEIKARLSEEIMRNPGFLVPDLTKVANADQAYEGRIALYEVMEITAGIKDMIMRDAPARDIFNAAVRDGMISLEQDGIIRALQ
ncbi:Flp pilus assembly complex ATPase component TadA [Candidatus Peribacteria bacterium]|nr:Flp pilus assembly complex ATPase component TadA [Candidatus Peribacteria bacterium]